MLGEAQPLAGRLIDWLTDWHRRLNEINLAACQRPVYLLQANELKNKLGCDLKVFLNSTTRQIQRGDALQMNSLSSHFAFWVASNPIFTQYGTLLAGINPCLLKLWVVFFYLRLFSLFVFASGILSVQPSCSLQCACVCEKERKL